MRRLSDKICCCCSSLLPPSSFPYLHLRALCVCVCSCCRNCLVLLLCVLFDHFVFVLCPFLAKPAIISDTRYLLTFLIVRRDNLARKYQIYSLLFPYQFAQTPCLPPQSIGATIDGVDRVCLHASWMCGIPFVLLRNKGNQGNSAQLISSNRTGN